MLSLAHVIKAGGLLGAWYPWRMLSRQGGSLALIMQLPSEGALCEPEQHALFNM